MNLSHVIQNLTLLSDFDLGLLAGAVREEAGKRNECRRPFIDFDDEEDDDPWTDDSWLEDEDE